MFCIRLILLATLYLTSLSPFPPDSFSPLIQAPAKYVLEEAIASVSTGWSRVQNTLAGRGAGADSARQDAVAAASLAERILAGPPTTQRCAAALRLNNSSFYTALLYKPIYKRFQHFIVLKITTRNDPHEEPKHSFSKGNTSPTSFRQQAQFDTALFRHTERRVRAQGWNCRRRR